ncbi:MAG: DUF87 domain-containing protein [Candidatus Gracilibacteria bacterium]
MGNVLIQIGTYLGGFIALIVLYSIFVRIQAARVKLKEKYSVVQVRVPKENESGPMVAEQIFATMHGIQTHFTMWEKLKGYSSDHVSFEVASVGRTIKFYVAFPEKLRNLVEGQIYANYPDVEIEDCKDYALEDPSYHFAGVELKYIEADVFPIKRYSQYEDKIARVHVDPMAGITSSLVKFDDPADQAWVQIVVSPLSDRWRIIFVKCIKILNKGILGNIEFLKKAYAKAFVTRKLWPKIVFFPVYALFWVQGLLVIAKVDSGNLFSGAEAKSFSPSDDIEEVSSKSHERETAMDAAMDKAARLLYSVNVRIIYASKNNSNERSKVKLRELAGAFKQFNIPQLNGFEIRDFHFGEMVARRFKQRIISDENMVMNSEELATLYHMPNLTVKTPTIYWVTSKKLEPPPTLPMEGTDPDITLIGKTNYRGLHQTFGIKPLDRRRHIYVIGKTGMGKSTLLENMIYSDIVEGKGVGVIDPHGDLAENVLKFVPKNRVNDVVLIDPADKDYAVAFNMLENVDPAFNSIICSGLVGIFKKIYAESWGPRLEHILRNTILALLEYPGTTMLGIIRILQDADFRRKVVNKVEDPVVKAFWTEEFEKMQDKFRIEAISPILNKVGQFLSSPTIRNIVGQPKSTIDLRFFMDKGKIVIVNLSKGRIGEDNSSLLGSMFVTKFQLDAMSRANIPEEERKDFYLYVDEFQNFATEAFATILSEARKYHLNLTMANQYIAQMPEEVRDAVFGNVGTILSFQVGFDDAEYISQQFGEEVLPPDLVSLSKYNAYSRVLVDGMPTRTFSLATLPPPKLDLEEDHLDKIKKVSRERYSEKVEIITEKIKRWSAPKRLEDDDSSAKKEAE